MEAQHIEPEIVEKLNGTWVFDQEATRDALENDAGISAWDKGIFLETLSMVEGSEISFSAGQFRYCRRR